MATIWEQQQGLLAQIGKILWLWESQFGNNGSACIHSRQNWLLLSVGIWLFCVWCWNLALKKVYAETDPTEEEQKVLLDASSSTLNSWLQNSHDIATSLTQALYCTGRLLLWYYSRVVSISFSTSGDTSITRRRQLCEDGVWLVEYGLCTLAL